MRSAEIWAGVVVCIMRSYEKTLRSGRSRAEEVVLRPRGVLVRPRRQRAAVGAAEVADARADPDPSGRDRPLVEPDGLEALAEEDRVPGHPAAMDRRGRAVRARADGLELEVEPPTLLDLAGPHAGRHAADAVEGDLRGQRRGRGGGEREGGREDEEAGDPSLHAAHPTRPPRP